jgi:hypothetical protein
MAAINSGSLGNLLFILQINGRAGGDGAVAKGKEIAPTSKQTLRHVESVRKFKLICPHFSKFHNSVVCFIAGNRIEFSSSADSFMSLFL